MTDNGEPTYEKAIECLILRYAGLKRLGHLMEQGKNPEEDPEAVSVDAVNKHCHDEYERIMLALRHGGMGITPNQRATLRVLTAMSRAVIEEWRKYA